MACSSPLCPSCSSGSIITCSGCPCCVVFTFLSHCLPALACVAVHSIALAITVQVARGQGTLGVVGSHWSLPFGSAVKQVPGFLPTCSFVTPSHRCNGSAPNRGDRLGVSCLRRAQLAIDATLVSLLRADGAPHRRCPDEDGAALAFARRRKERTYPELTGGGIRAKLVVIAAETGGSQRKRRRCSDSLLGRRLGPQRAPGQSWLLPWGSCPALRLVFVVGSP